jgi:uncharacterized protein YdeI (YjbR/CyaY-like superfamily)
LWVGFYKKDSGRPSITWPESVEEALCFGWIDGVRKSIDAQSYTIRFTPRKPGSNWSLVNIRTAKRLIREKRMQPTGLRAWEARQADKSGVYSFERRSDARFDADLESRFRQNAAAWRFFESQPPGYRRIVTYWVMSAKQPETRARRLGTLIRDSAAGRRIGLLQR